MDFITTAHSASTSTRSSVPLLPTFCPPTLPVLSRKPTKYVPQFFSSKNLRIVVLELRVVMYTLGSQSP